MIRDPVRQAFLGGAMYPKDSNGLKGITVFAFKWRILFDFLPKWCWLWILKPTALQIIKLRW